MSQFAHNDASHQRAGGMAALYLALALVAAMPYFLLVVDYPSATTAQERVALVVDNYATMYAMYLATYVVFGIALGILALALHERLREAAPFTARIATAVGLLWSLALVMSGMVFTYGMTATVSLESSSPVQAVSAWRAIEPIALALGGAGGEILGGLWVLLVSWIALRSDTVPKPASWLGMLIGVAGLASVIPALHDAAYLFGTLQIIWFAWLGFLMIVGHRTAMSGHTLAIAKR